MPRPARSVQSLILLATFSVLLSWATSAQQVKGVLSDLDALSFSRPLSDDARDPLRLKVKG